MELRKDYILDRWVIISEKRAQRPKQFQVAKAVKGEGICYFCPGNEHLTPPEIGRIPKGKSWLMRWFPNKFPYVSKDGNPSIVKDKFYSHAAAYGSCEVIVESPDHDKQLSDLGVSQIAQLLRIYSRRIARLSKQNHVKYVAVFKNHGQQAGTSLVHTHTQVATTSILPPAVSEEIDAVKKHKRCPYCEIIGKERKSPRLIYENTSCIAFAPYASRFNYEAWIFPKKHLKSITQFSNKECLDCAVILKRILVKLKSMNADYNFVLHYAPKNANLHFHIEVLPRMSTWGGLELISDIIINSVPPEQAAEFYRS
jgi:UDPglucose--hexose-1-phosphate uridylyltransferase